MKQVKAGISNLHNTDHTNWVQLVLVLQQQQQPLNEQKKGHADNHFPVSDITKL
jgi:hypothetical protein